MGQTPPESHNFEQALSRLENIIKLMESQEMPLEDMLVRYEEGINLVKFCGDKLEHAEKRIKIISESAQAKPELVDFDAARTAPTPRSTKPAKPVALDGQAPEGEVSLF